MLYHCANKKVVHCANDKYHWKYHTSVVTGTGAWVYPDACPRDYFVGGFTGLLSLFCLCYVTISDSVAKLIPRLHRTSEESCGNGEYSRGDRHLSHSSRHTQVPFPATTISTIPVPATIMN